MENLMEGNIAELTGELASEIAFSHRIYGEAFYQFTLGICRKSGYEDMIKIVVSERIIWNMDLREGDTLRIRGQIRTYNREADGRNRLDIVVFARELCCEEIPLESGRDSIHENNIFLDGFICKKPVKRTSPLGREICDIMLAVNRMYNKSDYIPCIAWGRNATYSAAMEVGDKLTLTGRIQSREYKKKDDEGNAEIKTAYEVSVTNIEI